MSRSLSRYTVLSVLIAAGVITAILLTSTVKANPVVDKSSKPNVIVILADDLGYGDLGVYGQQRIKTPNLDRMVKEGIRLAA